MELTGITVEKFKKIGEAKIGLSGLNILVGINGSGKSSALQAIHLASCLMRQARELRADRTSPVSINELDYLPSDQYPELGHNLAWGNMTGTPSSEVSFNFDDEGVNKKAYCEFRSARNAGISVIGAAPGRTLNLFRGAGKFFSAYIPGISGIPNQEQKQSKRVVLKACSFGDSNVYLRNVLNLLEKKDIQQVQRWLRELIDGPITIKVSHDEDKDLTINARVRLGGKEHPLELLGAGYLQLIQIFCYILLFKPQILLVDEPDIHLHPNVQEKLSTVLSKIAKDRGIKILLTTHSPFIVRGAPIDTNVYWMENGEINDANRQAIELALGWGAFGKKIIIVSEDKNIALLRKIVSQRPEIEKFVTFHPGGGYTNLLSPEQSEELHKALGGKYKLVIHRDRDSLTDDEVACLVNEYAADGITLWFTEQSDIEAYFCLPEFIRNLSGCSQADAESYLGEVLSQHALTIRDQFGKQRRAHNRELYAAGGGPTNGDVWDSFQARHLTGAKGRFVFGQLKNKIPDNKFSEDEVLNHSMSVEVAGTLKEAFAELLGD